MNERQERTADVLGKLTVLGTIVLPMNIICGMWGMNVKVPGQEVDNLNWFWSSMSLIPNPYPSFLPLWSNRLLTVCVCIVTGGLVIFGVVSFVIAKRVYRIVWLILLPSVLALGGHRHLRFWSRDDLFNLSALGKLVMEFFFGLDLGTYSFGKSQRRSGIDKKNKRLVPFLFQQHQSRLLEPQ